jgi:hypothetical protein
MTDPSPDPKYDTPDGHARPVRPAELPCSYCGRTEAKHLTILEALALHGYSRSDCFFCNRTDLRRGTR